MTFRRSQRTGSRRHDGGATVLDVRVLDTEAAPAGSLIGVAYGYERPAGSTAVAGTVVEPSHRYQLLFGVRLDHAGPTLFDEVRVRYRVGGRTFVETAPHQLLVCHPKGVECPAHRPRVDRYVASARQAGGSKGLA